MSDEEWVKAATVDDAVVAELLLVLKEVKQPSPPPPPPAKPALSLEWSVRQRRSKAVIFQAKKQAPMASPTTPLSWSAATSLSGCGVGGGSGNGSGGCSIDVGPEEESSRPYPFVRPPKRFGISRSKVRLSNPTSSVSFFITSSRLSLTPTAEQPADMMVVSPINGCLLINFFCSFLENSFYFIFHLH